MPLNFTTLAFGLFSACTSLKELTIPSSVTTLDNRCVQNCFELTNTTINQIGSDFLIEADIKNTI